MSLSIGPIPQGMKYEDFVPLVWDKLQQIEQEFYFLQIPRVHVEPVKPQDGQLAFADGVSWDPGAGMGAYIYDGVVAEDWRFLG